MRWLRRGSPTAQGQASDKVSRESRRADDIPTAGVEPRATGWTHTCVPHVTDPEHSVRATATEQADGNHLDLPVSSEVAPSDSQAHIPVPAAQETDSWQRTADPFRTDLLDGEDGLVGSEEGETTDHSGTSLPAEGTRLREETYHAMRTWLLAEARDLARDRLEESGAEAPAAEETVTSLAAVRRALRADGAGRADRAPRSDHRRSA